MTGNLVEELKIPEAVQQIIDCLNEHGYEAYAVGGCVRDALLGRIPHDWDITTSAMPLQVKELFPRTVDTGLQHGTVTIMIGKEGYEVTTYRIDGEYEDGRHPKEVLFTVSLEEDLKRRDFTINAMAYHPRQGIVDLFKGQEDLKNGIIRCVGNAMDRFTEDALRIMRAVRFSAQLGFGIEEKTKEAIRALADNLRFVSAERIQAELVKLLTSPHPEHIRIAYETGITAKVLPEFDLMMETEQNNPHHCYSVGEHTIHSMMNIEPDRILRLAMLFHDAGKPAMKSHYNGRDHFSKHPQCSEKIAGDVLRRLKFDNYTMDLVKRLVRWHDERPELTFRSVRRSMNKVGADIYPYLFQVRLADTLAQSDYYREEKIRYIEETKKIYQEIIESEQCVCIKDLKVDGRDLIALGMKPGPALGQCLAYLLEIVLDDPDQNEKTKLLDLSKDWMRKL